MHYHQAYWSIQASVSYFLSLQLFFTLHAPGWYGLVGQVVQILSWTSMRHTYLVSANQSALQKLTSLHPWASTFQSALRKSAWPHHWVLACAPVVLWHACQLCHDIALLFDWKLHHNWWWWGPAPAVQHAAWYSPWPRKVTSLGFRGSRWLQQGCTE